MKLNHLNLQVDDAAKMAAFLVEHFGFSVTLEKPDRSIIALQGDGFDLVLQQTEDGPPAYPPGFHFGFILANHEQVDAAHTRLRRAGVVVDKEISQSRRGSQFFFAAPGGLRLEIGCHH
ncbi:VOC family protein [Rugamonas sp. CCM 8940]|uniref:VOC family protein n=1 Tax=Rugamonas sp. CCM 8940 TaxID=2765359 RepID=UPI0018F4DF66|nr:VOC family protein [Rugamonas sp. CCM 8940]MBJ7313341.1 VOC family protein [Rugamonas sp. CCM 8940]